MSQRNPMNERYTTEAKAGGHTRKSAASAKPKSNAASSVVMGSGKKSKPKASARDKKREARNKQYENEKKYGEPPWKKFKIMKRLWIASLICSIGSVAASFAFSKLENMPEGFSFGCIIAAYVFIVITLYLDLGQIRRMKKQWVAQMSSLNTKESRAEEKKAKAAAREAAKAEAERKAKEEAEGKDKPNTILGKVKSFVIGK